MGTTNFVDKITVIQADWLNDVDDAVYRKLSTELISVADFGAVCDGVTDDTAAVQACFDSLGDTSVLGRGSKASILIPGFCLISDTITIRRKSCVLVGGGWGYNRSNGSGFIWNGTAGIPMLKIQDSWGFGIRNMRFIGKSTAKPSAAINFNESNDGWPITSCFLEHILIGALTSETDDAEQFTDGILLDGLGATNSEHRWRNIVMRKITRHGIHIGSQQNVNISLDGAALNLCATAAIYNAGEISGRDWTFADNAIEVHVPLTDDNGLTVNGATRCQGFFSEKAGRLALMEGSGILDLSGKFSISSSLNADGKIIKGEGSTGIQLRLEVFRFSQASAPPAAPYLSLSPGAAGVRHVRIRAQGWDLLTGGTNGMDLATTGVTARAYVDFAEDVTTSARNPHRRAENLLSGQSGLQWNIQHRESTYGDTTLRLFDDFLGDILAAHWDSKVGTDPQVVAPAVVAGGYAGICRMVTGDDAAGTMAVNGVQLHSALNWSSATNPLNFECRIKMSAITNVAVFIGFTDQVANLEMPFELAAGDTLTSNASNATGVLFDTSADTDNWWLVGVASDVDATKQNTTLAPVANTYETWRVEFEGTSANFYRNGVKVGSTMTGAIAGASLTPVVAALSRSTSVRSIDVDYVMVQSRRV